MTTQEIKESYKARLINKKSYKARLINQICETGYTFVKEIPSSYEIMIELVFSKGTKKLFVTARDFSPKRNWVFPKVSKMHITE